MSFVASSSIDATIESLSREVEKDAALVSLLTDTEQAHTTREAAKRSDRFGNEVEDQTYGCGVWCLGEPFSDQSKVKSAMDKLGPFLLETCECPLSLLDPNRDLFESDDGVEEEECTNQRAEAGSLIEVRGLQELQLNDVVDDGEVDDDIESKSESEAELEEVSDRVFEDRVVEEELEEVYEHPSKRKRKDGTFGDRCNFVKHNLHRRRKTFARKRTKATTKKSKVNARPAPLKPIRQESVC